MFYGVIGKLSQPEPEMKFRAKKDKVGFALTPEMLFDPTAKGDYTVSETNILNISQATYAMATWNGNQRAPIGNTRVYDYRPVNGSSATVSARQYDSSYVSRNGVDYWEDDLDTYYPGGGYHKRRNTENKLDFTDPKVSLAIDEFSRVYAEYVEKNLSTDLTPEELMEYYQDISRRLGVLLESLDVEEDFFEVFYSDFFEPEHSGYAIDDEEEDDLRDTPSVFSNPITFEKSLI